MHSVSEIKSEFLFPIVTELFEEGHTAKITVTGNSMNPFLRAVRDSVELKKTNFSEIKRGDIVLTKRINGVYVLHRVLKKQKSCFYIIGDAQQWIEGPLYGEQLIAKVIKVWRKGKEIKCDNIIWVMLSLIWLRLRIFRYAIMKVYRKLKNLKQVVLGGFTGKWNLKR